VVYVVVVDLVVFQEVLNVVVVECDVD